MANDPELTIRERIGLGLVAAGGGDAEALRSRYERKRSREAVQGAVEQSTGPMGEVPSFEEMVASETNPDIVKPRQMGVDFTQAGSILASGGRISEARQLMALGSDMVTLEQSQMKLENAKRVNTKARKAMDTPISVEETSPDGTKRTVSRMPNKAEIVRRLQDDPETVGVAEGILNSDLKAAENRRALRKQSLAQEVDIYRSALSGILTPEQSQWLQQNTGYAGFKRSKDGDHLIPLDEQGNPAGPIIDVPRALAAIGDEKAALDYETERMKARPKEQWISQSRDVYIPAYGKKVTLDGQVNTVTGEWKVLARTAYGVQPDDRAVKTWEVGEMTKANDEAETYANAAPMREMAIKRFLDVVDNNPTILSRPGPWSQQRRTLAQILQVDMENVANMEVLNAQLTKNAFTALKILGGARPTDYDFIIAQRVTGSTDFSPLGLLENLFQTQIAEGLAQGYAQAKAKHIG